jgi:acetyltransferase-like isoleucine patch superfamily enzyme
LLFSLAVIMVSPLILLTRLEEFIRHRRSARFFGASKEILAIVPTIIGEYLRSAYYWGVCTYISPDASFMFGSMLARQDTIVRAGCVIGAYVILGHVDIGKNVLIGAHSSSVSGKYMHGKPGARIVEAEGNHQFQTVKIGDGSWIGQGSILLESVGKNCTVGAGSVVFREVPDNTTVMGNPARKVSMN